MDLDLLVVNPPPPSSVEKFSVAVDYGLSQGEAIRIGGFNDVHSEFLPASCWSNISAQKALLNVYLEEFDFSLTTDEITLYLREKNRRPLNLAELLAFAEQYNDVQWTCPVIGLGSSWETKYGDNGFAYLWHNACGRALLLARCQKNQRWEMFCRFASTEIR